MQYYLHMYHLQALTVLPREQHIVVISICTQSPLMTTITNPQAHGSLSHLSRTQVVDSVTVEPDSNTSAEVAKMAATFLITGASGLIGFRILLPALAAGHKL